MGVDVPRFLGEHADHGAGLRRQRRRLEESGRHASARCSATLAQGGPRQGDAGRLARASTTLGAWLEQLLAESTGKQGKGIIPVDRERARRAEQYGQDRLFAYLRLESAPDTGQDRGVEALARPGTRWCASPSTTPTTLGQEFFRWEIATAVAGAVLGINPFDQPDVEASKVETRKLTDGVRDDRVAAARAPFVEDGPVALFADPANVQALAGAARRWPTCSGRTSRGSGRATTSRLLAYIPMTPGARGGAAGGAHAGARRAEVATLPRLRAAVPALDRPGLQGRAELAACSCRSPATIRCSSRVPGQKYTFGVVKAAQARGDFQVARGAEAQRAPGAPARAARCRAPEAARGDRPGGLRGQSPPGSRQSGATAMQIGMIGLGRMGGNMVRRLMKGGHACVVYDRGADVVAAFAREGATPAKSAGGAGGEAPEAARGVGDGAVRRRPPRDTVQSLASAARAPATRSSTAATASSRTTSARAKEVAKKGIHYVDAGTSGGVWGAERGYCLMVGGPKEAVRAHRAGAPDARPGQGRHPAPHRAATGKSTAELGYLHCGPSGSGHFVKMVHNGIEYGLMQAYAEGFDIFKNAGSEQLPEDYRYDLNIADIAELWRRGQRGVELAARPHQHRARRGPDARELLGVRPGLGRGPVDGAGGGRGGGAGRGADRRALHALPLAAAAHLRREAALGDAQAVRRSRGTEVRPGSPAHGAEARRRRSPLRTTAPPTPAWSSSSGPRVT